MTSPYDRNNALLRMKKTLLITLEHPPDVGGIATYVHQFASALPSEDIIVYAPAVENSKVIDRQFPYKVIRKNPFFPRFIWPRWLRLFFQVRKIVKQEKIEVILLHHVLPVGYVAWLIRKLSRVPYIVFSHGTDVLLATQTKWKTRMTKKVLGTAEQIVFNSESLKRRLLHVFPDFDQKSLVLYPCPEEIFFTPSSEDTLKKLKEQYALQGKRVLLTVSRFVDGKGIPHLIRVMPFILKRYPHVVWMLVGDGPKKDFIIEQIQKNNLQNIVRFLGEIPHRDLVPLYHLADVFTLLTHPDQGREEGLGLVFLEAAAAALPVVAGKSGGVDEAVVDGETGILVDVYQDPGQKIADSIVNLLENQSYADKLGKAGQQRMRETFQWQKQIAKLDQWLQ